MLAGITGVLKTSQNAKGSAAGVKVKIEFPALKRWRLHAAFKFSFVTVPVTVVRVLYREETLTAAGAAKTLLAINLHFHHETRVLVRRYLCRLLNF